MSLETKNFLSKENRWAVICLFCCTAVWGSVTVQIEILICEDLWIILGSDPKSIIIENFGKPKASEYLSELNVIFSHFWRLGLRNF